MTTASNPLDIGCSSCSCIDRRTFVAQTTLAAVGALLAACSVSSMTDASGGLPLTIDLAQFPALTPVGGMARVDGGSSTPVAVVHSGPDTYEAFSLRCPHQGFLVNINGSGFLCSGHGARFNADGQWTGGQQTSNLRSLSVAFDAAKDQLTIG